MISALLIVSALGAEPAWEKQDEQDGLVLETQKIDGSSFDKARVTGTSTASADVFARAWWGKLLDTSGNPEVQKREALLDEESERYYYDIVRAPMISDRDYVVHGVKSRDEKSGVTTLRFDTVDDPRRPPKPDVVRMSLQVSVVISPEPKGGCRFVYTVFSDVKGSIPSVFVNGPLRRSTVRLSTEVRKRAEATK